MYKDVVTINPLAGACIHNCKYCSTKSFKRRFKKSNKKYSGEPRLYKHVLKQRLGEDKTYFICNMVDLFADNVPAEYITEILSWLNCYRKNTYILQTKNPRRYFDFLEWFGKNIILATTIETDDTFITNEISDAPSPSNRVFWLERIGKRKMVVIEPIMRFHLGSLVDLVKDVKPEIVYIGADSKRHNLPEPSEDEVKKLVKELEKFTKVIIKSNMNKINRRRLNSLV